MIGAGRGFLGRYRYLQITHPPGPAPIGPGPPKGEILL